MRAEHLAALGVAPDRFGAPVGREHRGDRVAEGAQRRAPLVVGRGRAGDRLEQQHAQRLIAGVERDEHEGRVARGGGRIEVRRQLAGPAPGTMKVPRHSKRRKALSSSRPLPRVPCEMRGPSVPAWARITPRR